MNKASGHVVHDITQALRFHQTGQLHEARRIYEEILRAQPNDADALHFLGVLFQQIGETENALDLIKKAIKNDPENPFYHNNLGIALTDQNKPGEAITHYHQALALKPDYAEAFNNLGIAYKNQGEPEKAISCYRKALALKSDYAEAKNNMGIVFQDQGDTEQAIALYAQALSLKPGYVEAYNNLAIAYKNQGEPEKAIGCYQQALKLSPKDPQLFNNMGDAFQAARRPDEAISCYREALRVRPDYAEAYNNLGIALKSHHKLDEAILCYQRALELKPDMAEAFNNMGNVLKGQDKIDDAVSCYKKALALKPNYADAHNNMGKALHTQGKPEEAVASYQRALAINPDNAEVLSNLIFQSQQIHAWEGLDSLIAKLDTLTDETLAGDKKTGEPPGFNIARQADPARNLAVARSWSRDIEKTMSNMGLRFSFQGRRGQHGKIAIGYLSYDFRAHAVAHLMLSLFGLHDRNDFEVFCYSYGPDDGSLYRKRIQQDCDKFVELRHLGQADAARAIYEDQVDILVDLMAYTKGNRMGICALRPAPIQVNYLGYPGTSGADFMDYILTDRTITPEDHAPYYSEHFVYLPHCYQVNDHNQAISNTNWQREDVGLPRDAFVFCSFNQSYKIEPVMFDTWMRILKQVPGSVLWVLAGNDISKHNLKREAGLRGVDSSRLVFAERMPKHEHLSRQRLADLALDTRIYNGHVTTSDALWAGVPVVAMQGSHFASRVSSSIVKAIGLSELVVQDLKAYENLAVRLASRPTELQHIREKLAHQRLTEPLFDTPRFARNLEKAYRQMWQIFLSGKNPRPIAVEED